MNRRHTNTAIRGRHATSVALEAYKQQGFASIRHIQAALEPMRVDGQTTREYRSLASAIVVRLLRDASSTCPPRWRGPANQPVVFKIVATAPTVASVRMTAVSGRAIQAILDGIAANQTNLADRIWSAGDESALRTLEMAFQLAAWCRYATTE